MALRISYERAVRSLDQQVALIRAVLTADPLDESECVEWKAELDLSDPRGGYQVGRNVLGMANRDPQRAARWFEGCGYVIVGAEPGKLSGVTPIDPAQYSRRINAYTGGSDGPPWSATYVHVDEVSVFLVTVEPPRAGDPIWTLAKEYDGPPAGTVLIRKPGETKPADPADQRMLQQRLLDRRPSASIEVSIACEPLLWIDLESLEVAAAAEAYQRGQRMLSDAEAVERRRTSTTDDDVLDFGLARVQELMKEATRGVSPYIEQDERTFDEYRAEVEAWQGSWAERFIEVATGLIAAMNQLQVVATNPTEQFLPDVEIEIRFEQPWVRAYRDAPDKALPVPPRPFGEERRIDPFAFITGRGLTTPQLPTDSYVSRTWIREGSVILGIACGDLRGRGTFAADDEDQHMLALLGYPEDGVLRGEWTATVRERDGVLSGPIELPVAHEPVPFDRLLAVIERDD